MSTQAFITPLRREGRLLRARPWDLAMISWVPFLAAFMLFWIFSAGLARELPVAVWDDDRTSFSRQIIRYLDAAPNLKVTRFPLNSRESERALRSAEVYAVFYIPQDTERNVKLAKPANIVLLNNTQFANHSSLIDSAAQAAIGTIAAGIELQSYAAHGTPQQGLSTAIQPIVTNAFPLFNISTNYEQFLGISLIPAVLYILAMTAGAWSVGRELRDKTIGQWLGDGQFLTVFGALIAKLLIPWFFLSLTGAFMFVYGTVWSDWFILGSLGWVCLAFAALMALSLCVGAALASITMSLRAALSGAGLISAPSFAFSGAAFPLLSMMPSAKVWAIIMPFTHFANLQIGQTAAGASMANTSDVVAYMAVAVVVILLINTLALKRALRHPEKWGSR